MNFIQPGTGIVLQVTLIVCAITLFFFLYASRIEEKIVVTQIDRLVDSFTEDMGVLLEPNEKISIQNFMENLEPPNDMTEQDEQAERTNSRLISQSAIIIGAFMVCGLFVTFFLGIYYQLDWKTIVKNAFFGVGACMLTEYVFLTYFAANYRSLDPNTIKRAVIDSLEKYANS